MVYPYYCVYRIVNLTNNKQYIGQHKVSSKHDYYMGGSQELKDDIRRLGKEHFYKEILFTFDNRASANKKEQELVNANYINYTYTYNKILGGYRNEDWTVKEKKEQPLVVSEMGKQIIEFRKKNGLTQKSFCSACNISIPLLLRLEKGKIAEPKRRVQRGRILNVLEKDGEK